jgi:cyanophycinase-like exopeptidase
VAEGFRIRDLGSNNGTFVNGKRIEECLLVDGDKIRIGDTVLGFTPDGAMSLPDNGVVANSCVRNPVSESADTALRRLLESAPEDSSFAARARSLLQIGARLNASQEPATLAVEILKQLVDVTPADQAAIVLLAQETTAEPAVIGWNRRRAARRRCPSAAHWLPRDQRRRRHFQ